jgi:hypothetical protein
MKKHLALAALAAAITTTAALAQTSAELNNLDLSSANFQAAVQRAAEQALQAKIDDAEWYQRQNARQAREAADDAIILNHFFNNR